MPRTMRFPTPGECRSHLGGSAAGICGYLMLSQTLLAPSTVMKWLILEPTRQALWPTLGFSTFATPGR